MYASSTLLVRFCVDQRPGLSKSPRSGEPALADVWPSFSKSGDSNNTLSSPGSGDVQAPIDDVPDEGGWASMTTTLQETTETMGRVTAMMKDPRRHD